MLNSGESARSHPFEFQPKSLFEEYLNLEHSFLTRSTYENASFIVVELWSMNLGGHLQLLLPATLMTLSEFCGTTSLTRHPCKFRERLSFLRFTFGNVPPIQLTSCSSFKPASKLHAKRLTVDAMNNCPPIQFFCPAYLDVLSCHMMWPANLLNFADPQAPGMCLLLPPRLCCTTSTHKKHHVISQFHSEYAHNSKSSKDRSTIAGFLEVLLCCVVLVMSRLCRL